MHSPNAPFFAAIYAQLIVINIKNKVIVRCTSVSMDYHACGMQRTYGETISEACKPSCISPVMAAALLATDQ